MTFFRLTGSLVCAMGITLICCFIAPLMSRESNIGIAEPHAFVQVFSLPSPVKKNEKIKARLQKVLPNSTTPRKKKLKRESVLPQKIQPNPLTMETSPLIAMGLAPLPPPLPAAPRPIKAKPGKTYSRIPGPYLLASVDVQPSLKRYRPPLYPPRAKGQRIEGKVVVRCVVTAGGKVKKPKIINAKPAGYFERAALKAVKKWTFVPAKLGGKKVAVYVDIPLSFTLD